MVPALCRVRRSRVYTASFFLAPRMFIAAKHTCSTISA